MGRYDTTSPRLALRWLRERTRHITNQLDAAYSQPGLHWLTDNAEHERALAYMTAGTSRLLGFAVSTAGAKKTGVTIAIVGVMTSTFLLLPGELAAAEPKKLRYRPIHAMVGADPVAPADGAWSLAGPGGKWPRMPSLKPGRGAAGWRVRWIAVEAGFDDAVVWSTTHRSASAAPPTVPTACVGSFFDVFRDDVRTSRVKR